ncbi:hypothetical protein CMI37_12740 [Candidatus Pacearchaeota archaeon]|nr:hypothetical protein [Candidatus Pacearchaeota archaeon]|tara:strand:- start:2317 stop:2736 length:420 start_codon:yes stop_codon:yes gene_type:complete
MCLNSMGNDMKLKDPNGYVLEVTGVINEMINGDADAIDPRKSITEQTGLRGLDFLTLFSGLRVNWGRYTSGGNIKAPLKEAMREIAENPDYCSREDSERRAHLLGLAEAKDISGFCELLTPQDVADMVKHYGIERSEGV